ncbi:MAG: hypothetical protein HY644_11185 [Acidobacteria bacterium]|nr:hypothetical protein [Acidobacteriota bacterium]
MKRSLVVLALYLVLGSEANAFNCPFPLSLRPFRSWSAPACIYSYGQFYKPLYTLPARYTLYRSYYTPYRYAGSKYLPQQSSTLPLGWNRYYLASRMQIPYSLIIQNIPAYSSYGKPEAKEPPPNAGSPVGLYTVPLREISRTPAAARIPAEVSLGMTEEQVKSELGQPLIQVVLGDARSFVYDRVVVEFDKGRVRNVIFK